MLSKNYSNTVLNAFPPIVFFPSILMSLLCLFCVIHIQGGVMLCFGGLSLQC